MSSPHESQGEFLPPPMPTMPMPVPGHTHPDLNILAITEDTAREAFIKFASGKCCYSSSPARDGVITRMEAFNTYRYALKTFRESRSTEWIEEPYNGQSVEEADMQAVPDLWEIPVQVPPFFKDQELCFKVPHTSFVKGCPVCLVTGMVPCRYCILYTGHVCHACRGLGFQICLACHGRGRIVVYVVLNVKWTSHTDVYVVEQNSGLKADHLSKVSGKKILKDTQTPMVFSLRDFPHPAVVEASERLKREHHANYGQISRIRQQRQTIELIPITRVSYVWEEKSCVFIVFGNEFKVSSKDYPAKSCCCSVL